MEGEAEVARGHDRRFGEAKVGVYMVPLLHASDPDIREGSAARLGAEDRKFFLNVTLSFRKTLGSWALFASSRLVANRISYLPIAQTSLRTSGSGGLR